MPLCSTWMGRRKRRAISHDTPVARMIAAPATMAIGLRADLRPAQISTVETPMRIDPKRSSPSSSGCVTS